ncbi:UDP-glucose 4-epimerase GalE [Yaniella halotolerans]|uniref:UDP-glucose 4-epimerase GalE n=1 Tax=Yaniella halotolerans TaxID=225453 RepID=UPI0003B3D83F|nr:UDP-glucose 4-epimerase GalE [Yaniella halotolerans]
MRVLLTGGAGYIGSHTAVVLLEEGHDVAVLDDLSNSHVEALNRVEQLTGKSIDFLEGDLADAQLVQRYFDENNFDAVIHLAGLKAVGESVEQPTRYYQTNLSTTLTLLDAMRKSDVQRLVFSSSATVYGDPQSPLISEEHPVGAGIQNPYGWSKLMNEQIIRDTARAWPELSVVNLRYFNPVGAHSSGRIGEDPSGIPNNLMPFISQVAVGKRLQLAVFGQDYDTRDGTGVRDYIHVMDLAEGHVAALAKTTPGVETYNLGTGTGTSVLEAVQTFEHVSGKQIPYEVKARREGDLATVIADSHRAGEKLGWQTSRTFEDACRDAWKWQVQNPDGYGPSR